MRPVVAAIPPVKSANRLITRRIAGCITMNSSSIAVKCPSSGFSLSLLGLRSFFCCKHFLLETKKKRVDVKMNFRSPMGEAASLSATEARFLPGVRQISVYISFLLIRKIINERQKSKTTRRIGSCVDSLRSRCIFRIVIFGRTISVCPICI